MSTQEADKQLTIERLLKAPLETVWKMWTTKEGLEKWWGPEGFTSVVRHLDVRVGGRFEIVMTAVTPEIIAHLASSGIGASSVAKGDYTVVETHRRLVYANAIDFIPGVAPYTTTTTVELSATAGGTRLVVLNGAMHSPPWTEMARLGWQGQLDKLARLMA
jgi:uncharacterized protein YndB with AHSA1/START domain